MNQDNMFDALAREDAQALAEGRTITIVRGPAVAARVPHICYGGHIPDHCRCPQPGTPSTRKMATPKRGAVRLPDTRQPTETLPRPRQEAVDMSADTVAQLTPERLRARASLARHVEQGR